MGETEREGCTSDGRDFFCSMGSFLVLQLPPNCEVESTKTDWIRGEWGIWQPRRASWLADAYHGKGGNGSLKGRNVGAVVRTGGKWDTLAAGNREKDQSAVESKSICSGCSMRAVFSRRTREEYVSHRRWGITHGRCGRRKPQKVKNLWLFRCAARMLSMQWARMRASWRVGWRGKNKAKRRGAEHRCAVRGQEVQAERPVTRDAC